MGNLLEYLEPISYAITIFGVPVAIFVYAKEQLMQRMEREYGTYDALDDKYIELQQLCLDYPDLDIFDTPFDTPPQLTEQQARQEEAILLIRLSIFERAFLMYNRASAASRKDQWEGWRIEINEWLARDNFRKVWQENEPYFDQSFVAFGNSLPALENTPPSVA